jgi:hypothetical protein
MRSTAESGVAIAGGNAETLAGRLENALELVGENENVEAIVLGFGAAALSFLLGYAIIILSKCALGIFAIGIG